MVGGKTIIELHSKEKQDQMLKKLRTDVSRHFLERSACDINDALTLILAVGDTEAPAIVPKIKKYIQRINDSLQSLKIYQSALQQKKMFNIKAALDNILDVVEDNLKDKIVAARSLAEIKAYGQGDQSELEELLLYFFVQMAEPGSESRNEFFVELRQKKQNAVVAVSVNSNIPFPEATLRDLRSRAGRFQQGVHLTATTLKTELTVDIPLIFPGDAGAPQSIQKPVFAITSWTVQQPAGQESVIKIGVPELTHSL